MNELDTTVLSSFLYISFITMNYKFIFKYNLYYVIIYDIFKGLRT